MPKSPSLKLIAAAKDLCAALAPLRFSDPVSHVYNPLVYAWPAHEQYITRFGGTRKKVIFLGMNPGPWGMAQTGVPFGEVASVRDWMGINVKIGQPSTLHPKRPIQGFDCPKSEVSGRRLWGFFSSRFPNPEGFFKDHYVANYCPLVFMLASGANLTPDKLSQAQSDQLTKACDNHLAAVIDALEPKWLIGVGDFAKNQAARLSPRFPSLKLGKILHPSPASPAANRDWAGQAGKQLQALGLL